MQEKITTKYKLVEKRYLLTFILITSLFALWGFANDITNPMVAAFQTLMELSATEASLVQLAFYGGYATMAVPAALFIRKYSYKSGILLGLGLYAVGAFLFIPAAHYQEFSFFCASLYILTFGLAFLETTANPLILSLGARETSTQRLNLAQAFNPMGSLMGMAVASSLVLPHLISDKRSATGELLFPAMDAAEKANIRLHDLAIIRDPYVVIGIVVLVVFVLVALKKIPRVNSTAKHDSNQSTLWRLWHNRRYRYGVVAQMFYVGAQIMVWTFIIHYANNLGINKAEAQNYNICAMCMFLCSRFLTTFLMKYVKSYDLLTIFGIGAIVATAGCIFINGMVGLYCLVAISFFMSLMFPTIYGIALENVDGGDTNLGSAFLVMAIVGGALMPPLQGMIIDIESVCGISSVMGVPMVNISFVLPLICFVAVALYGYRCSLIK